MPFYEYRPKSGLCTVCNGCFVDLQKMSDVAHAECPDCGQACERVIAVPMVSVRGAEYRAAAGKEKRTENLARAVGENAKLREASLKNQKSLPGHTHNCALFGCYGDAAKRQTGGANVAAAESGAERESSSEKLGGATPDATTEASPRGVSDTHRFGGLPHLVGVNKKTAP